MNGLTFPYLVPYFLSLLLSIGVSLHAWHYRNVSGAIPFAIMAAGQGLWTFGYIFELTASSLEAKVFWDNFEYFGAVIWPYAFFIFAYQYSERPLPRSRSVWGFLTGVAVVTIGLAYTDNWHGLMRPDARIEPGEPFSVLYYDYDITLWVLVTVYLVVLAWGFWILGERFFQAHHFYRRQMAAVVIGCALPPFGTILTFLGVTFSAQRDISPILFGIGGLIIAWGLFRYRLFDVVPVARVTVIESLPDGVVVIDTNHRVVDINHAALDGIGRSSSEVIGMPAQEVFAQWPHLIAQFHDVQEAHTEITVEIQGQSHQFELRVAPVRDQKGCLRGRVLITRDITEKKRAEQEIQQRSAQLEVVNRELAAINEQLRVLSRIKDEFVSNVSHELRTPITSLKFNFELLRMDPATWSTSLERLERETGRLERIIEDLLRLSRLDQRRVQFNLAEVDLNQITQEYVSDRAPLAERRNIQLRHEKTANLPPVVADPGLIGQALSILLTNALNYTPGGGLVVVRTLTQRGDNHTVWAGFSVCDTGPGIAAEEQEVLFTRFYRGKAGRNSAVEGTGLGLSIAKEIVNQHRGQIEVKSSGIPGEGATFTILLPQRPSPKPVNGIATCVT